MSEEAGKSIDTPLSAASLLEYVETLSRALLPPHTVDELLPSVAEMAQQVSVAASSSAATTATADTAPSDGGGGGGGGGGKALWTSAAASGANAASALHGVLHDFINRPELKLLAVQLLLVARDDADAGAGGAAAPSTEGGAPAENAAEKA